MISLPSLRRSRAAFLPSRRWVAALIFASLSAAAWATTVVAPAFPELVNSSDCIVRAVVTSVTAARETTTTGYKIHTYVALEVKEVIAGTPASPLVLRQLGGRVGKDVMTVDGTPHYAVGDEAIFFVQGNGRQFCPLVAVNYGLYPILRDPATKQEYVARSNRMPLHSVAEVAQALPEGTSAAVASAMANPAGALTPAQFVQQIRGAVNPNNRPLLER